MRDQASTDAVRPFLAGFSTPRTGGDDQTGRYSDLTDLWMIDTAAGPQPLAAFADHLGQTSTLTKVSGEMDDTDLDSGMNIGTHTAVSAEADDLTPLTAVPDLITQTFVATEADDVDRVAQVAAFGTTTRVLAESDDFEKAHAASLLAVTTKTDAQLERDDTAVGLAMYEPSVGGSSLVRRVS